MIIASRRPTSCKSVAMLATLLAMPSLVVQAQPPAKAEVDPQPVERTRKPRAARQNKVKPARVDKQDKLVENFEALFGRKLTTEQLTQLKKATEEREAATRAAQQAWRAQFSQITGVTETELKQKQRDLRQKNDNAAKAAPAKAPLADAVQPAD